MQLNEWGPRAAFYDLASDEQLDWIPPPAEWAAEQADIASRQPTSTRASSRSGSEEAGSRAEGAQAHQGDVDEALGGRGVAAGAHALPHPRHAASEAGCRCASTRTSITTPVSSRTATR